MGSIDGGGVGDGLTHCKHPAALVCAAIQARTAPTCQAVTRSDNLMGLGNVPAFTLRHSVGALKGRGAGVSGRDGLWTSWDSRMNALSDSASNIEGLMGAFCAGMLDAIGVLAGAGLGDISVLLLSQSDMECMHHSHPEIGGIYRPFTPKNTLPIQLTRMDIGLLYLGYFEELF